MSTASLSIREFAQLMKVEEIGIDSDNLDPEIIEQTSKEPDGIDGIGGIGGIDNANGFNLSLCELLHEKVVSWMMTDEAFESDIASVLPCLRQLESVEAFSAAVEALTDTQHLFATRGDCAREITLFDRVQSELFNAQTLHRAADTIMNGIDSSDGQSYISVVSHRPPMAGLGDNNRSNNNFHDGNDQDGWEKSHVNSLTEFVSDSVMRNLIAPWVRSMQAASVNDRPLLFYSVSPLLLIRRCRAPGSHQNNPQDMHRHKHKQLRVAGHVLPPSQCRGTVKTVLLNLAMILNNHAVCLSDAGRFVLCRHRLPCFLCLHKVDEPCM